MSTFTGRQGKGAMAAHRRDKRTEAEARNAVTPHDRTRAHREVRCIGCTERAA